MQLAKSICYNDSDPLTRDGYAGCLLYQQYSHPLHEILHKPGWVVDFRWIGTWQGPHLCWGPVPFFYPTPISLSRPPSLFHIPVSLLAKVYLLKIDSWTCTGNPYLQLVRGMTWQTTSPGKISPRPRSNRFPSLCRWAMTRRETFLYFFSKLHF